MEEPNPCLELPEKQPPTNIDRRGDVILKVGPLGAKRSFRVSSSVLSLGSPVFAAMLSSAFIEGNVPTDGSERTISLQEDNPGAVDTLLNILHLQSQNVTIWKFSSLEQLALLCDKYDCARALKPWTTLWLQQWRGSANGDDNFWKMLYISYAFDDPAAFNRASQGIVQHYTEYTMDSTPDTIPGLAILPDNLISCFNSFRLLLPSTNGA